MTLIALSFAAFIVSVLLASRSGVAALPGCGQQSRCVGVVLSRWARVGAFRVDRLGVAVYAVTALAAAATHPATPNELRPPGTWSVLLAAVLAGAGAAAWFLFVQAALLKQFCAYCTAAHLMMVAAAGLAVAGRPQGSEITAPASVAGAAVAVLILVQWVIRPRSFKVVAAPLDAPAVVVPVVTAPSGAAYTGRRAGGPAHEQPAKGSASFSDQAASEDGAPRMPIAAPFETDLAAGGPRAAQRVTLAGGAVGLYAA
ncbi:MAG TPA: vitamin K epoxide reductase family protein, partial [Humisphaera sp.]